MKDPEPITKWPGGNAANETREKVPSKIAYVSENPKLLTEDVWGYGVFPGLRSYCWTKLLLDTKTCETQYDDPLLQQAVGSAIMGLPPGKSAEDVVADYLGFMYQHCLRSLEEKMTPAILAVTPLEFWFTMPAIWSDSAQFATKRAAERAGFGSRPQDEIRMITEPEAAALAAFKSTSDNFEDVLQVGLALLATASMADIDTGQFGGTCLRLWRRHCREFIQPPLWSIVLTCQDITTYTIRLVNGEKKLEESCVGLGKCLR